MKVLVHTDIEGVAGVVSFEEQGYPTGKYYERAKSLLTAEINAAVEGLLAEGAEDILVNDGHGPGAVVFEELHPEAKLFHGRPTPPMSLRREVYARCDLAIIIGQHAMAAEQQGTLNHTQSSRTIDYYKLNGRLIGEIAQTSLFDGALGVPVVFLSGDSAACREIEALIPGVATAAVKEGMGRQSAITLSREASHRLIREGVKKAMATQRTDPIAPLAWESPYVLEKRYLFTDGADGAMRDSRAQRIDSKTVRFEAEDVLDIIYA